MFFMDNETMFVEVDLYIDFVFLLEDRDLLFYCGVDQVKNCTVLGSGVTVGAEIEDGQVETGYFVDSLLYFVKGMFF